MRLGASLARSAFDEVPATLKPTVRQAQTRKMQEESQTADQILAERSQLKGYADSGYLEVQSYSRRPANANFRYCGVDEFEGVYHCCEVKNSTQQCPQFAPKAVNSASNACASCRHNWKPPDRLHLTLEETLGRDQKGQQLRDQVRQQLEYQAEEEYQSCVDGAGFLQTRPGVLPLCEARSSEGDSSGAPTFVVGPIVNAGKRCSMWAAGSNGTAENVEARLRAYGAQASQAGAARTNPFVNPYADPLAAGNPGDQIQGLQEVVANAEADVIEFCLLTLGADPSFSASVATRFASDVWYAQRRATTPIESGAPHLQSRTAAGSDFVSAASTTGQAEPSEPFLVEPAWLYTHPLHPIVFFLNPPQVGVFELDFEPAPGVPVGPDDVENAQVIGSWMLSDFEPGVWTRLYDGRQNPLPLTLNVQPPATVYGAWY